MHMRSHQSRLSRCAFLATALRTIIAGSSFVLVDLLDGLSAFAGAVEINREGREVTLTWEGEGILQSADDVIGPWRDELGAFSPHRVVPSGTHSFYRIFYPFGLQSFLEPPEMAFAEPDPAAAQLAHELVHVVQQKKAMERRARVNLFSGEVLWTEVDLHIKGRGLDFIWARKHRSRAGPNTAQGNRWDFSYNVYIQRVGENIKVFDGNGRADVFYAQRDGTYAADQFFCEGRFESNNAFKLTFATQSAWEFRPLTAALAPGKISRIVDRNGNALTFSYDALGRLSRVTDTLDREILVGYNRDGFIESVTDFAGRQVRYAYYQDSDAGGSAGDLRSVTSPIVTGTPNGNDFPAGKTTSYTYTKGFTVERANHMLTAAASGDVNITHDHAYQHNQSDLDFLRVIARRVGNETELEEYTYVRQTNGQAVVKTIVNDRVGNVSEHTYDAGNRPVLLREFTGRATPGERTTETLNRPTNSLRTNDPPFFETRYEWNVDSMLTRAVYPNGNSVANTYELAVNPDAARRSRGNLQTREWLPGPLGGDQTRITERFDYAAGFPFVTRHTDGRSNDTFYAYDARGNCTNIVHRIPNIVEDFEYNESGQLTAYVAPDNGGGQRDRFNGVYLVAGAKHSYLHQVIEDPTAGGLNLTTIYEYDAVGNVTRVIDPRGNDSLFTYNALDQLVRAQSALSGSPAVRYARDYFYDAKDNLVRLDVENRNEAGTLVSSNTHFTVTASYDVLNCRTQLTEEVSPSKSVTTEFRYDANRNLTLIRFPEAVNGNQPENALAFAYDERDLLFQETRAPGSAGASTTFVDYDPNANCKRVAKVDGFVVKQKTIEFDGFNRLTAMTDAMGNVANWHYDPNGNVSRFRVDGELEDVKDGLSNTLMTGETIPKYDAMDRLIQTDEPHFDPGTRAPIGDGHAVSLFTYTGTSQPLTVTDDNGHTTRYTYDRANRLASVTDPKTNSVTYAYDAVGNRTAETSLEKSDLGNPPQSFTTRYTYDALNRLTRVSDNGSNTVQYAYDSRNNTVLLTDPLGAQSRYEYDGLNRQFTCIEDMNANGIADKGDIVLRQAWDDSSRLTQRTDDNENTTSYTYDALNRPVRTAQADGTAGTAVFDAFDNVIRTRDANSNVINFAYDLLNRVTNKTIAPGPGVSSSTTFERFAYDGLSRLVRAQNDASIADFAYDSLGNLVRHQVNGKTNSATFDGVGNPTTATYPGGRKLGFTYDANDNRTQIDEGGNNHSMHKLIGFRPERQDNANRTRSTYTYDGVTGVPNPAGDFGVKQLIRTTHSLVGPGTVIDDRTYRWDPRQSKSSQNDLRTTGLHQYTYDAADRLVHTTLTQPSSGLLRNTTYVLDGVGNRTSVTNNAVTELYTRNATTPVPADSQVNQYTTAAGDALRYDENGNLTRMNPGVRNERQFEFDYANRLTRVIEPANQQTNQFVYDALGRRIRKTSQSGSVTQVERYSYAFEGHSGWQLVEEQNSAGTALATYVYDGRGGLVQMRRGANDYFYHCDDLGNVRALTDESGNAAERYEYGDFGAPQIMNASGTPIAQSAIGNPYLFNGLRYDSEVLLYFLAGDPNRPFVLGSIYNSLYLDPALGRFITRQRPDDLGNALTFAGNNPSSLSQKYTMFLPDGTPVRGGSGSSSQNRDGSYRVKVKFPWLDTAPDTVSLGSWSKAQGMDVEWNIVEYQAGSVYSSGHFAMDLQPVPGDPSGNTIYVGSANGGVWKTSNGGTSYDRPSNQGWGPWEVTLGRAPKAGTRDVSGLGVTWDVIEERNGDSASWLTTAGKYRTMRPPRPAGGAANRFTIDPLPGRNASGGPGVYRSMDGGRTWSSYHNPKAFQIISAGKDGAAVRRGSWVLDTTRPTAHFNPYEMTIDERVEWKRHE